MRNNLILGLSFLFLLTSYGLGTPQVLPFLFSLVFVVADRALSVFQENRVTEEVNQAVIDAIDAHSKEIERFKQVVIEEGLKTERRLNILDNMIGGAQ